LFTVGSGSIVPGTVDTGNHVDDGGTVIALPFSYTLYDQTFNTADVGSNGHVTFGTPYDGFGITCLPESAPTYAIGPYWGDQRTDGTGGGIFTSVSGTAPNRIFNIEWRTIFYGESGSATQNYEVRLYEGQTAFDVIYGTVTPKASANDSALTVGVQRTTGQFTSVGCDPTGGTAPPVSTGQLYHYTLGPGCPSPTPAATPTPSQTLTPSPTPTATATATGTPITPTPTPPCMNYAYTVGSGTIVPGTTDTGNHADDNHTLIPLPFAYTLYDTSFSNVSVGSNGHLTFGTVNDGFNIGCIPVATATYAIGPYWADQCTGACANNAGTNLGIFTSTSGTAPNRIFNIEWRTAYYNDGQTTNIPLNYEVRLYEGQTAFDVIYGLVTPKATANDGSLTVGVQKDNTGTQSTVVGACDPTGGQAPPVSTGQRYHYTLTLSCGTPTPTPASINISGTISYCSNPSLNPVPGVTLTLTGSGSGSTLTDGSGNYTLSSLAPGGSYTVTPTKAALAPSSAGIDTVDVVAVQRHFLNLGTPLSGCRLTAADVNADTGIDTVDVIAVQRFFLGLSTGIANTGKYQFNPVSRSYPGVVSNQTGQNYDALVFGDVASGFVYRPGGGADINANDLNPLKPGKSAFDSINPTRGLNH
jgi:hypothetical protein